MKQVTLFCVIFIGCLCEKSVEMELDYEITPERIEPISGGNNDAVDFTNFKIGRRKRNYYFKGNFSFLRPMDNTFKCTLDTAYSPMGNNQFIRHPFRLPLKPMCSYYNTTYRQYIEPMFIGHSNFPVLPKEGLCPLPLVKDMELDTSQFPPHVPHGLWRLEEKYFEGNTLVGGVRIYGRVMAK